MNNLYQRVAYLRGMADGMNIGEESKEGKLLLNLLDVLEDFADAISDINDDVKDLDEYVETLDEDLADVEDELFGELDDDDDDDDDEEVIDDIDFVEIECPSCGEVIYLDEDLVDDEENEVICPNCHEKLYLEEDDECCDKPGCCGHNHE
ncbi:MAG: hypothetical protein KGZ33_06570 [Alkaliphilus sp.]|nr:hypothetical protein [Alkaliphilus sp.]